MMTERFTASNGWYVEDETLHSPSGAPHVWLGKGSKYPYPAGSDATALIEYGRHLERTKIENVDDFPHGHPEIDAEHAASRESFLAERDAELGRWRSKTHPDYVVYPRVTGNHSVLFGHGLDVVILRESDGDLKGYARAEDEGGPGIFGQVAREYFDAQEPPKPWLDAKPGEVWVLKTDDKEDGATVLDDGGTPYFYIGNEERLTVTDPTIVAGERLWPRPDAPRARPAPPRGGSVTAHPNMTATPAPKPATHFHVYPLAPGVGVPCSCNAFEPRS